MFTKRAAFLIILCILYNICLSHDKTFNNDRIDNSSDGKIKLITYNLWGLPFWLPKVGINKRYDKLVNKLSHDQHDILCLQECFSKRLRKKIFKNLGQHYNYNGDILCDKSIIPFMKKDCYGGLLTLSKFPIIEEIFFPFPKKNNVSFVEKIGSKGFLITKVINSKGDTMQIVNTHLYAGESHNAEQNRLQQIMYIDSILNIECTPENAIVMCGDFNVNPFKAENGKFSKVYLYIIENMGFEDTVKQIQQNQYTLDRSRNFYSGNNKKPKQKLDYIFFKDKEDWKFENSEAIYCEENSFSDHLALYTEIRLE